MVFASNFNRATALSVMAVDFLMRAVEVVTVVAEEVFEVVAEEAVVGEAAVEEEVSAAVAEEVVVVAVAEGAAAEAAAEHHYGLPIINLVNKLSGASREDSFEFIKRNKAAPHAQKKKRCAN